MTKLLRLALVLSAAFLCLARAQDDQQEQQKPPTEIPDFNNLDEYIYVPKSNLNYGYRYISGVKASFSGYGVIAPPETIPNTTDANVTRVYHDGQVNPDTRTTTTDLGNGSTTTTSVNASDGKTNSWTYDTQDQLTSDGFMQFHIFSGQTDQNNPAINQNGRGNTGLELYVSRDMKRLTRHWEWKLFGGFSINDIQASTTAYSVPSQLTTLTDSYDLYGVTPPSAPYTSPSSISNSTTDSSGNTVTTNTYDTVLISTVPVSRTITTTADDADFEEQFKLHGAYATFRAGPQLVYDFNDHLKASLSAGPAVIYAGTTYQINAVLTPPNFEGAQIIDTVTSTTNRLLLGYYVDGTLQYDLTDRTGFYFGLFDQSAGSYVQGASSPGGVYDATVNFSNQEGIRTGMSYKF